jgi:hypothetical protein
MISIPLIILSLNKYLTKVLAKIIYRITQSEIRLILLEISIRWSYFKQKKKHLNTIIRIIK